MRGRAFRRAIRRPRRSVAWIDGLSGFDDSAGNPARAFTLSGPVAGSTNTWGAVVQLTNSTDLTLHGGEDAVLTRIRGRLAFIEGRRNSGAGLSAFGFPLRVTVARSEILPSGAFNQIFTTSLGLGDDDILWQRDTVVSSVALGTTGLDAVGFEAFWIDVDVRAKRRLTETDQVVVYFQTVLPAGTTAADFRMLGSLRTLLMRPR